MGSTRSRAVKRWRSHGGIDGLLKAGFVHWNLWLCRSGGSKVGLKIVATWQFHGWINRVYCIHVILNWTHVMICVIELFHESSLTLIAPRCWCHLFCFLGILDNFDRIIYENDLRRALGTAADLLQAKGKTGRVIFRHATPGGVRGKMGETLFAYHLVRWGYIERMLWLCPGKVRR